MSIETAEQEFLDAACQAMSVDDPNVGLDALGWWEMIDALDDADARTAVFSVFRAQGRSLAPSPAICGLMARPLVAGTGIAPGSAVAALRRHSLTRGDIWVLLGETQDRKIVFTDRDRGVFALERADVDLIDVDIPGGAAVREVAVDLAGHRPLFDPTTLPERLVRSRYLGRVAAALDIVGAAEAAVDLAVDYARERRQFNQPIGAFQAVRHLLAWGTTDCVAIDAIARTAIELLDHPPERFDLVVKALAGRNGRRACERSLQVLGGIGFSAEHDHHRYHSRVMLLDAVLGSSARLTSDLGQWMRATASVPAWPREVLVGGR